MSMEITWLVGKLGRELPVMPQKDWDNILGFVEFFVTAEEKDCYNFDWSKLKKSLILLGRVQDDCSDSGR